MAIYIDEKICKGCKLCIYFCPNNVFQMGDKVNDKGFVIPEVVNETKCTKCKLCELTCPDLAIFVSSKNRPLKIGAINIFRTHVYY